MLRLSSIFSLFVLMSFLTSCGPIYSTKYDYIPPKTRLDKMCVNQCIQAKTSCEQLSAISRDNCLSRSKQDAIYQFEQYKSERQRKHLKIEKDVSYFDNGYFQCQATDCTPNYNSCYTSCGGKIVQSQVCVAFCGNAQ